MRSETNAMRPKTRLIIEECVERGALLGIRRAHKHIDSPSEDGQVEAITRAIMEEIYTYFDFDSGAEY